MTGFAVAGKAQGPQIVFDSFFGDDYIVSPDTAACFNDPLNYNIILQNIGSSPYTGNVTVMMQTPLGVFIVDSLTVTAFGPGAMDSLYVVDSVSAARFGGGTNIIVIWPEVIGYPAADTVRDTIVVLCPSHADDALAQGHITAYPNPSLDGRFFLQTRGLVTRNTPLEVYDAAGRIVWRSASWSDEINLYLQPKGVYLLRAYPPNAEPVTVKLVR